VKYPRIYEKERCSNPDFVRFEGEIEAKITWYNSASEDCGRIYQKW
jgi:hypothetical protein